MLFHANLSVRGSNMMLGELYNKGFSLEVSLFYLI